MIKAQRNEATSGSRPRNGLSAFSPPAHATHGHSVSHILSREGATHRPPASYSFLSDSRPYAVHQPWVRLYPLPTSPPPSPPSAGVPRTISHIPSSSTCASPTRAPTRAPTARRPPAGPSSDDGLRGSRSAVRCWCYYSTGH